MKIRNLLPVVAALVLTSCGPISNTPSTDIVDLKTAMQAMAEVNNFAVDVTNDKKEEVFKGQYHRDYYYESVSNSGYLLKSGTVYPYYFQGTNVKNKEALSNDTLYGESGVLTTFGQVDFDLIKDGAMQMSTLKKGIALPILSICGFDEAMYVSLNQIEMKLDNKEINITFEFSGVVQGEGIKAYKETAKIYNIGGIQLELVEDFINSGSLYEIDSDLLKIRELFETDNYTQYQGDGINDVQVDIFHKEYFMTLFTDYAIQQQPVLQMNQAGYLTIERPDMPLNLVVDQNGKPVPLIFDDTYRFQYYGTYEKPGEISMITRPSPKRPGYAEGGFVEVVKDVPNAFHYPKSLELFDNLDEFIKIEGFNAYSLLNQKLIDQLLADYSLTDAFDEFGGIHEIQFIYDFGTKAGEEEVILRLVANAGKYDIRYNQFNVTKFQPFEDILAKIATM